MEMTPATDKEKEAYRHREVANGVRTDDFVKAVSWCSRPIHKAIRDIFLKTTDIDILLAALPGIEEKDRTLIRDRLPGLPGRCPGGGGRPTGTVTTCSRHSPNAWAKMRPRPWNAT